MAKLAFLGAAGSVTGSKFLVEAGGRRLLVDCGLFQGTKELRRRNWDRLPEDPASFDWVLLTHAHLDHTGYLPRLMRDGFRGPIYASAATCELLDLLLPDSAHLQEEDAEHAQSHGYSKHSPPLPLYTVAEVQPVLEGLQEIPRSEPFRISPQFSVRPHDAGHILGSSSLELTITENGKSLVVLFSGDLGRYDQPILKDPEPPPRADFLLCESTYGDRDHPTDPPPEDALAEVVNRVAQRGGVMVIPAFAVGRTQLLMYDLRKLEDAGRIPRLPAYVDSPMAISVTDLYLRHREDHDLEFTGEEASDGDPLSIHTVHLTRSVEESKQINDVHGPCIIISASGMATGGRVLHHLARRLPDSRNAVILAGFQAEGTRGRALLEGAKTLRIHGEDVPVKAEVVELKQFSAHADRGEILRWLSQMPAPPRQTFLIHGEPPAAGALRGTIQSKLNWPVAVAEYHQEIGLSL
ncbi:MAG TPA: MBL fold metallo-hydrolase [Candidatus Acidoferrales bacterium]|nr:MBL fold metallo-hydrolase [Candidatus Acidoferrales bacterium]